VLGVGDHAQTTVCDGSSCRGGVRRDTHVYHGDRRRGWFVPASRSQPVSHGVPNDDSQSMVLHKAAPISCREVSSRHQSNVKGIGLIERLCELSGKGSGDFSLQWVLSIISWAGADECARTHSPSLWLNPRNM